MALTVADFEPTDSGFVQAIKVVEDGDGNDLQVNSITIKNNATAPLADAGDIDKIEIYQVTTISGTSPTSVECDGGTKRGETTDIAAFNSAGGVTISLTGAIVANNATNWFCVKIITKSGLTPGRKIKSRFLSASGIDPSGVGGSWSGGTAGDSAAGIFFTKASGLAKAVDDTATSLKSIASGETKTVQIIDLADKDVNGDFNTAAPSLTSLVITNLGTALAGADIDRIEVFDCGGDNTCDTGGDDFLVGLLDPVTSFPATVPLGGATVPDDGTSKKFAIKVRVTSTPGRTIQLRTVVNVLEGGFTSQTGNIDVATGSETIIEAAGFETFQVLGTFTPPATITSGATNVAVMKVQAKDGGATTNDANNQPLKVTSITINNLGTATLFGDITNIEIICSAPNGSTNECESSGTTVVNKTYTSPATFPQTFTGTDILATGSDIDIPDNDDATFEVRVTISSTPGNTIQLTFALSGTEGTLGSFNQGPVNHTQVTTIASGIGCEVIASEAGVGPPTVQGGDTNKIVQIVKCQDSDANSDAITVNSVTIDNLGTATPSDIARVAVYMCDDPDCINDIIPGNLMGQQLSPVAFPVTIATTATITDDQTRWLGIVVDVSSTIGNTIQTRVTNVVVTEGTQTTTHAGPFDDDTPSTITGGANRGCEVVTDLNVDAGSIPSGTSAIVQRLVCADADGTADSNPVLITQVNVRNLGNAVGPADVNKIEIVRMDTGAVVGSTTNTGNFNTSTGVNIPVSVTVPDDGSVELGVRVYVTSTPGRTIQPRTTLRMFEGGVGPFFKSADDGTAETIAAPAACPPIVQSSPAPGQIGVLPATPALRYTAPDQFRTVRVRLINRSSTPIIVEDISEQIGQLFSVEGVTPTLPRTVNPNRSVTFFVRTLGPSTGDVPSFPHSPTRPYFVVDINCQGPTGSSPASTRKLELSGIRAEVRSTLLRFEVQGDNIAEMSVQLYDLKGRLILSEQTSGKRLTVRAHNGRGQRLAKGVYLYVVTVRGWDGQIVRSEIRKIVVK